MLNSIFIENSTATTLSIQNVLICLVSSIIMGVIIAYTHMKTTKYTKNFVVTLVILPALVQVVMIMVNGNLGSSVAVLGAFSLVRFRSIPGNSKEIISVFWAMAVGLAVGMGHIAFAVIITVFIALVLLILSFVKFGVKVIEDRKLKITIPENLDYTNIFKDIFEKYTKSSELVKVKTTNMGSMYELTYNVLFKSNLNEKDFIDEIRCRNGNLTVILSRECAQESEL